MFYYVIVVMFLALLAKFSVLRRDVFTYSRLIKMAVEWILKGEMWI